LKTHAIQLGKTVGAIMLLIILVKGISATLLYVSPAKDWLFENEDGDYSDVRLSIAFFGGFISWFWIINKIRRADMNDEDKEYSDRQSRLHRHDDED
jgi:hypothetical protein